MKRLFSHPLFATGLLIRLVLMFGLAPLALVNWYAPFLDVSTVFLTLDPWSAWLAQGGYPAAFPYGYAMWIVFLPLVLVTKLLGLPVIAGYMLSLLACDISLLLILHRLIPHRERLLLAIYWLSPIVILASYGLGLNDLIPILFLTLSLNCTRNRQLKGAGALCATAISAKLSMVIALPFFIVYLYNNRSLRLCFSEFISAFVMTSAILLIPFALSTSGIQMLVSTPEIGKIYALTMSLGTHSAIYLVPLIYLLMLYYAWRVRRPNFDLFQSTTGLAFLMIVFMTPASPGWFLWSVPFLIFYQAMSGRIAIALTTVFSILYALSTLISTPLKLASGREFNIKQELQLTDQLSTHLGALLITGMVAIGIILTLRIWREAIHRDNYFRLSRKPFVIGIAGDSGAGKDTYADALIGLFGPHSAATLSGDDYHLWDRQKPMWQVMTHLNPMANDLEGFSKDLIALTDGKSIQSRHYDHASGKMGKPLPIHSNDFIVASGLHALYMPILRDCYNLKVYLDIDEGLRRHFKLQRDVHQRGHTLERVLLSFDRREPDSARFIRPQASHADLILSLHPIHSKLLTELQAKEALRLKLVARTRHGFNELSLTRVLVGVCGLHVDNEPSQDGTEVMTSIEGDASPEDIALAAQILCPRIFEFLDFQPKWQAGVLGLMQLITLSHINQALTKRII
jgi:uridine kinase